MVLSYKSTIDQSLLEVLPSVKNNETGKWESNVKYDGKALVFKTPRIFSRESSILFKVHEKKEFLDYISQIEQAVVKYLFNNSEVIFKGKKFSEDRIKNSLQPSLEILSDEVVSLICTIDENVKCFNHFGDVIDYQEISDFSSTSIKLSKIDFSKDLFRLKFVIVAIKSSRFEKKLPEFDITDEPQKVETGVNDYFFE